MTTQRLMRAATALALLLAAGCSGDDSGTTLRKPQSADKDKKADEDKSAAGQEGPTVGDPPPDPFEPPTPVGPGHYPPPPVGSPPGNPGDPTAGCNTPPYAIHCTESKTDKGELCTTCYDAKGAIVKHGCSMPVNQPPTCGPHAGNDVGTDGNVAPGRPGGPPAGCMPPLPVKCTGTTTEKGESCTICYDDNGTVIKQACSDPGNVPPSTCPKGPPPIAGTDIGKDGNVPPNTPGTPPNGCSMPPPPVKCTQTKTEKGEVCMICYDDKGTILKNSCISPPPNDPPMPGKCFEETSKDGTVCKICTDPNGKEIARGCAGPAPSVHCQAATLGDLACKICYDARGVVVFTECSP